MNIFKWTVGISAITIAMCAAYFSVTGIALLFSGSIVGVGIMAASLEFGKLVTASYLHREWNRISTVFKLYLTLAIILLIAITSLGIFGYLSNAYQKTALGVDKIESQVMVLEESKLGLEEDLQRFSERISILTSQRSTQESRYDSLVAGENWVNATRTYELIVSSDEEIRESTMKVSEIRTKMGIINQEIFDIKESTMDLSKDIGGFKFIANAFNLPIETVVKWFIIIIIIVFDPLAISLVIAFNSLITKENMMNYDKLNVINEKYTTKNSEDQKNDVGVQENKDEFDEIMDNLSSVSNSSQSKPNEKRTFK